jgi:hypothetical protein
MTELKSGKLTLPLDSLTGKVTPALHNRVQVERTLPAFLSTLWTLNTTESQLFSGLLHGESNTCSAHQNRSRGGVICYRVNPVDFKHHRVTTDLTCPLGSLTGKVTPAQHDRFQVGSSLFLWIASRGKLSTTESE